MTLIKNTIVIAVSVFAVGLCMAPISAHNDEPMPVYAYDDSELLEALDELQESVAVWETANAQLFDVINKYK